MKMTKHITHTAGIDTGKAFLDIARHPGGEHLRVANDPEGHARLVEWLALYPVDRIGIEASGGYERDVVEYLRRAGFTVILLQPRQVKAYAVYKLRRAKNDRVDAALIAACVAGLDTARPPPDPRLAAFDEHLRLIEQIETDIVRAKTRLETYREKRPQRFHKQEIARLERRLKAEMAMLLKDLALHQDLMDRLALIETVDGIGRRTAITLLLLMPELGSLSREQAAALAGLAPFDHDSGVFKGQRRIAGGRDRVRRALFAAALPASFRWNKELCALYKRLTAAGKEHKKALIACARKLLIFANTVVARGNPWQKTTPLLNGC